jgi:hypothetical protein
MAFMFSVLTEKGMIFGWYGMLINHLPDFLCKPLGSCPLCFVGQVCLWYFVFTEPFNLIECGFFVSVGIFLALLYNTVWKILRRICKGL